MLSLETWLHLLGPTPRKIVFPYMELMSGRDREPPVLVGSGEVNLQTPNSFEYTVVGKASDDRETFGRFLRAQKNPYETFDQFRLIGKDETGLEWQFGWTRPIVTDMPGATWSIMGEIQVLSTDVSDSSVNQLCSAENIIEFAVEHPMARVLGAFTTRMADSPSPMRQHQIEVLGASIEFRYRPDLHTLSILCPTTEELPHPYLENWLTAPFRIIFGQCVYPRLVARNFGNGRAMVNLRRSPGVIRNAGFAALWGGEIGDKSKDAFWSLYARLLTFIARARDARGDRLFEENPLGQFYQEVAQTARGTRWVWALTLASVVEGQTRMLVPPGTLRSDVDPCEVQSLCDHILAWKGSPSLRDRAIQSVASAQEVTATRALVDLRKQGVISDLEVSSWKSVRNEVMHGALLSPWSEKEEDEKLGNLASLFHKLTMQILKQAEGLDAVPIKP
ncbi:MAG: hypothetical protein KGJ78_10730 [Alphaproteobacteria bacterium]|nr:hypothetical protein [Alphaproteobacteria bacterium]